MGHSWQEVVRRANVRFSEASQGGRESQVKTLKRLHTKTEKSEMETTDPPQMALDFEGGDVTVVDDGPKARL